MKKYLFLISLYCCFQQKAVSQNIGINATGALPDASAMLDVSATSKGMLVPRMTSAQRTTIAAPAKGLLVFDNETTSFWFYNGNVWVELVATGTGVSNWSLNGTHIYNNNTGNVGIGTNTPVTKLSIQTGINTNGWTHTGQVNGIDSIIVSEGIGGVSAAIGTTTNHAFRLNAGPGGGKMSIYPSGDVVVGDNNVGAVGRLTVKTTNNADGISHIGENGNILKTRMGGTSAGIGTFSNTNMRIFSNSNSVIFIASATGNVGIGAVGDNPIYKLDVGSRIRIRSENPALSAGLWLNDSKNTSPIAFMGMADDFSTGLFGSISGWGLIMNVNTGNVGIGTLNPTEKLAVNGTIRTKEVIVDSDWADYVFDKKYKLHPLDEVEKFIQINKHLPNIPSAKEIEDKGLHMGDVQKKMMEKIEELTLYVIELKKEVTALKASSNENK
ncbi:MAG: hypothetical protein ABIR15_20620 [Chitinophagaceae bacterium]